MHASIDAINQVASALGVGALASDGRAIQSLEVDREGKILSRGRHLHKCRVVEEKVRPVVSEREHQVSSVCERTPEQAQVVHAQQRLVDGHDSLADDSVLSRLFIAGCLMRVFWDLVVLV